MNCQQIDNYILDYCENKLPDNLSDEIREHLKECVLCRNNEKWTQMESEILQQTIEVPPLENGFSTKVMQTLQARDEISAANTTSKFPTTRKSIYAAFTTLAIAAVILLVIIIPHGKQKDDSLLHVARNTTEKYEKMSVPTPIESDAEQNKFKQDIVEGRNINIHDKKIVDSQSKPVEALKVTPDNTRDKKEESKASSILNQVMPLQSSNVLPIPAGIPPQYHLVKRVIDDAQTVYYYGEDRDQADSNINFTISVSKSDIGTNNTALKAPQMPMGIASIPVENTRTIEYNDQLFTVKIVVILPNEEANHLLSSIVLTYPSNKSTDIIP